ncbi:unnamed protein product [Spirodela intermedia]|uniref:Uncharacterized protein n=1 Tax=Spirodela intermedia TaxID=51605 RepID=A0A7I8JEU3_SPIIN|nr:unnamed protein product [Spirodela intermedia]CAA6668676.1 unnamed protein product [Spirodela intermedia]
MRRRCTGILSVREDRRAVSTASKALLGQRRCGGSSNRLRRLSPSGAEKRRLCGSPAAVTRQRGAGWR